MKKSRPARVNPVLANTIPKKKRKLQRNPIQRAEELRLQSLAFDLTIRGFNARQIAAHINVPRNRAARLVSRALDEALADRDALVHLYMAKGIAQADALLRAWMPRAMGYAKVDENGQPVLNPDGTRVVVDPDPRAAMVAARVLRDRNILIGYGTSVKVEHTGANGGPIVTAHLDAQSAAAKVRAHFANAPQVILTEGQEPGDVPDLVKH